MSESHGELYLIVATADAQFGAGVVDAVETTVDGVRADCVKVASSDTLTIVERDPVDGLLLDATVENPVSAVETATTADVPVVLLANSSQDQITRALDAGAIDVVPRTTTSAQYELVADRIAAHSDSTTPTDGTTHSQEYEEIFNKVTDAIAVFDPESAEILDVNDSYHELLGYDDLKTIQDLGIDGLSATDEGYTAERARELIREVGDTGTSTTVEWQAEDSDGDRIWLEVTLSLAEVGGNTRVLSIQRDVTERRELEQTYQDIFENVSDGLVVHDPETGEILEVNDRYCEITGYSREELLEDTIRLILPDNEAYSYEDAIHRIRRARAAGPQLFEFKGQRKDGEQFVGEIHLRTVDIRGTERVLASVRDITERKRREQEYEQIFNGVNDSIVIQDPETAEPIDANETFLNRLGYDDIDAVREHGFEEFTATDSGYTKERAQELCQRVMETGEPAVVEWKQVTKDGDERWIEGTVDSAVIRGEDRILSIQRDITGRKRRERAIQALQDATERLQSAQTSAAVGAIAAEAASEALDLPMARCWLFDSETETFDPVAETDAIEEKNITWEISPDSYEYEVFLDDTITEYTPREQNSGTTLSTGVLLPLANHGLVAAGTYEDTQPDSTVLDVAKALADHVTTALERVEREQAVRESERRFRLIAERIDEVIYLAEPDFSEVLYVNPAYEDIWGHSTDELYDDARAFLDAVDPRDRETFEFQFDEMIADIQAGEGDQSYEFEFRVRHPEEGIRWVTASGYSVELSDGTHRFVGIAEEVTDRKRREQRLEVFNRILRHNLRNQLDVIRSHAEELRDATATDDADHIISAVDELAAIGAEARRTDQIVSTSDAAAELSLSDVVKTHIADLALGHTAVDITVDVSGPAVLVTNREAIEVAVESALENAVEYAESQVTVSIVDERDGYTILIQDDGPGIPQEEIVPIKTGTETTLAHGTGLGLWQLRWGVNRCNGELSFDTSDGTTVCLFIPDQSENV
jgi:PAS domain S-box-containing protein